MNPGQRRMTFYQEWLEMAQQLPAGKRGAFLCSILEYGLSGKRPNLKGLSGVLFAVVENSINTNEIKRKSYYHCKEKKSELDSKSDSNLDSNLDSSLDSELDSESEKENEKEKVSSPSSPIFKNQKDKEQQSADAQTDAHALKATAKENLAVVKKNLSTDFESMMPEHLKLDPDFRAEWLEWLKSRKERRKPVSQLGAARQLKLLGDYSAADAIRIIETSITNDYQGLFPCKVGNIKPIRDYTGI